MADGEECFYCLIRWPWPVGIDACGISHIVALLLQPANHVVFPSRSAGLIDHDQKFTCPVPVVKSGVAGWPRVRTIERYLLRSQAVRANRPFSTVPSIGVRIH